ncbi:MAG TPA: hypothetical protein DCR21_04375 [Succinivibrionaceae bacterium]|nr:sulfatase-like hydrolase/transferase [Succinivibrio sp.]HAR80048.1 hypothetical protein [Succinivibrionaceae bacterium]
MILQKISSVLWLSLLCLPLAIFYSTFYGFQDGAPLFVNVSFYSAAAGLFFLLSFIYCLLLIAPIWLFPNKIGWKRICYAVLLLTVAFICLAVDAHTFWLYRFHVSIAMLDLFWHGGSEILEVSSEMASSIAIEIVAIILYAILISCVSLFLAKHRFGARKLAFLMVLLYVFANGVNCYANAVNRQTLMEISTRLPLYFPLSMNGTLIRAGIITEEDLNSRSVSLDTTGAFNYPLHALKYRPLGAGEKLPNILILAVDALRYDMLDTEIMPYTSEYAKTAWNFENYFSAGNATRDGIFSLFYGIPSSYWHNARNSGIPAAMMSALRDRDYRIGTFSSANLYSPEFHETVFATFNNLRFNSKGTTAQERDDDCIKDFEKMLMEKDSRSFFSFVFLDNVHSSSVPDDAPHPFTPYHSSINHLELTNDTDPTPYLNLYKNAAYFADMNIKRILDLLKKYNVEDNTIVIITADHGQEFNENHLNFWGHNGNFTKYQLQVPLVVKWPDKGHRIIKERAVGYDVSTTIMQDVLGVENPTEDYSVGQNLFDLKPISYFLAGSYIEFGIVEQDRIVLIDRFNALHFKDLNYRDSSNTTRDKNIFDALMLMNKYLKRNNTVQ